MIEIEKYVTMNLSGKNFNYVEFINKSEYVSWKRKIIIKEINFSCKKCHDYFKHEETIALFKQHSYHLQCFLCTDCQKQL